MQNSAGTLQEFDYENSFGGFAANGVPVFTAIGGGGNSFCGGLGSQCFAMATDLETSNGVEISGLNAEEQSDIALIANWKSPQVTGTTNSPSSLEVYSYYDAMIVLRENNVSCNMLLIFFRSLNLFNKVCGLANKINMSERDGNNFGLNDSLKYYEFELDSLDNSGGYSAGSSPLDWPIFLIGGKSPLYNIAAIKIIEVQIPFTWYVINSGNNTFTMTEITGGTSSALVTLPVGNYTSTQLATNLAAALNLASPNAITYTVVFVPATQKYTITNTSGGGVTTFSFTFGLPTNSGTFFKNVFTIRKCQPKTLHWIPWWCDNFSWNCDDQPKCHSGYRAKLHLRKLE